MSKTRIKIAALEEVAKAWTNAGISWAVTNGLENYPDGIGRDLDVIVEKGSLKDSVRLVVACLSGGGWAVIPNRQGWIWWIVAFREAEDGSIVSLQIDLFEHLQWAFTWVAEGVGADGGLVQRGPFVEDLGARLAKRFLLHALSKGSKAFETKPAYLSMSHFELSLLPVILSRVSGREWPKLMSVVAGRDLGQLDHELASFRKACHWHSLKSSGRGPRFMSAFQKQWVVNIHPKQGAPVIEISGCSSQQGSGAMLETLQNELEDLVFQKVHQVDQSTNDSGRALRRLSCLQVVLIFVETRVPSGLKPDIRISPGERDFLIEMLPRERKRETHEFSKVNLRRLLLAYFQKSSCKPIQRHHGNPL